MDTPPTDDGLIEDGSPQEWRRLANMERRLHALESVAAAAAPKPRPRRTSRLAVIILVASLLIIGFGVQQARYQHAKDDRDRCIARYNTTTEQVRDDRIAVNKELADAQTAKGNAGDSVLLTALDLIRTPRTDRPGQHVLVSELTHDLIRFARRKHRLDVTQQQTETALAAKPYPSLDC